MKIFIYALANPLTREVRYVGLTRDIKARIRRYRNRAHTAHLAHWLKSLQSDPLLTVLEVIEDGTADKAERRWIAYFRASGARLLNFTDGGEGAFSLTPETIAKMKDARRRNPLRGPMSDKHKAAIKAALKGRCLNPHPSHFLILNKKRAGIPLSEKHRLRVSEATTGKIVSTATRQKLSEYRKLQWQNPSYREKMSAVLRANGQRRSA